MDELFQSTPSARRATRPETALQAGRPISIHALREESDPIHFMQHAQKREFQSTPSARRATVTDVKIEELTRISIHALREESDDNKTFTDLING